jgi:hypothetical protein
MLRILLFTASAVVYLASAVMATIIQIPTQYTSIQKGINMSRDGDTVLVSPGVYFENISFRGHRIVLASRYLIEKNSDLIRSTIIDGSRPPHPDSASVALFGSGEDSTTMLYGFTLTNGIGTLVPGSFLGGGVLITANGSPTIKYNIIRGNSALVGGGIAIRYASATVSHNAIVSNDAGNGAGISIESSHATISHNVFRNNSADTKGGALLIRTAYVDFINNAVTGNFASIGGGLYCEGGLWSIEYCDFYGNVNGNFSGCDGGGLGDNRKHRNFNLDSADIFQNIFIAPQYVNPAAFDFSLACTSRLIDAGSSLPEAFPVGGAREDIGMFEYTYRSGDLNSDGRINLVDATILVNIIFSDSPVPCPLYVADCDCNRRVSIADLIALLNYWLGIAETDCLFNPTQ